MNDEERRALAAEIILVERVRNILHAHNRPHQPLPNDRRIECRGTLEGVMRRLTALVSPERTKENGNG